MGDSNREIAYFSRMVLVTGSTGLLGSHVLLEVLKREIPVRALIRPENEEKEEQLRDLFLWHGPENLILLDRVEWVYGDLLDIPSLEIALQNVHTVYHCAGIISFDPAREKKLLRINGEGTRNLVNLCLELGVSALCHVSSISVISGNGPIKSESDDDGPAYSYGYAASKYLAEMEVWRAGQEGLSVAIVNPGVIIGPGSWSRGSGKLFQEAAKERRFCPPGGTGFIGVSDVAKAMLLLMDKKLFGERFILVSQHLTFFEILGMIANAVGMRPPSKILKRWHLEILWRLDGLRVFLGGKNRRLTKVAARSLNRSQTYSGEKFNAISGFEFQKMSEVIYNTADYFRRQNGI